MDHTARLLVTLAVGATLFATLMVPVPAEERGLVAHGAGFVVLPYLALALASRSSTPRAWARTLIAFLVATTFGVLGMLADAPGGAALEWIVPAQVVVAALLVAYGVARRSAADSRGAPATGNSAQAQ